MGTKLVMTGLLLSVFLTVPAILRGKDDPPDWVKVAIILPGCVGVAMIFIGALVAIWA